MSSNLASSCSSNVSTWKLCQVSRFTLGFNVRTKAVSSWGLEISDALTVVLAGICVGVEDTFVDTGLADAFEGVAIEVTFSGRAAEDGGGIITE
jgi:hypothetical protein